MLQDIAYIAICSKTWTYLDSFAREAHHRCILLSQPLACGAKYRYFLHWSMLTWALTRASAPFIEKYRKHIFLKWAQTRASAHLSMLTCAQTRASATFRSKTSKCHAPCSNTSNYLKISICQYIDQDSNTSIYRHLTWIHRFIDISIIIFLYRYIDLSPRPLNVILHAPRRVWFQAVNQ